MQAGRGRILITRQSTQGNTEAPQGNVIGTSGPSRFDAAAQLERFLTGRYDSSADAPTTSNHFAIMLTICPTDVPTLGERVLSRFGWVVGQGFTQRLQKTDEG